MGERFFWLAPGMAKAFFDATKSTFDLAKPTEKVIEQAHETTVAVNGVRTAPIACGNCGHAACPALLRRARMGRGGVVVEALADGKAGARRTDSRRAMDTSNRDDDIVRNPDRLQNDQRPDHVTLVGLAAGALVAAHERVGGVWVRDR